MNKLLFIIALLSLNTCFGADTTVSALKNQVQELNKTVEFNNKRIEEYKSILESKFQNESKARDMKIDDFISQYFWLKIICGGVFCIGLFLWFFQLPQRIVSLTETRANEVITQLLDRNSTQLKEMIKRYDAEEQLKNSKKIIVLYNHLITDIVFLTSFFNSNNFTIVKYLPVSSPQVITDNYDLLFLYNEDGFFSNDIQFYLSQARPKKVLFNFGKTLPLTDTNNFSSANFRSQIYGNLVSSLHYLNTI